jgi:hypothetical protein
MYKQYMHTYTHTLDICSAGFAFKQQDSNNKVAFSTIWDGKVLREDIGMVIMVVNTVVVTDMIVVVNMMMDVYHRYDHHGGRVYVEVMDMIIIVFFFTVDTTMGMDMIVVVDMIMIVYFIKYGHNDRHRDDGGRGHDYGVYVEVVDMTRMKTLCPEIHDVMGEIRSNCWA